MPESTVDITLPVTEFDVMTVNGEATASDYNGSMMLMTSWTPDKAFDNTIPDPYTGIDFWLCPFSSYTAWLSFEFPTTTVVNGYGITPENTEDSESLARRPKAWTFEGSLDGDSWTVLDTRANIPQGDMSTVRFYFTNTVAYKMYRINITENWGSTKVSINELEMYYSNGNNNVKEKSMSLFQNLLGTMSSDFLVGGPSGIMLRKTTDGFEVRSKDGSALKDLTANNLIANTALKTDSIVENTLDNGVVVEGVTLKDGLINGVDIADLALDSVLQKEITDRGDADGLLSGRLDTLEGQNLDSRISTVEGSYIKKDGTVAFTGNQAMGAHKITGLADPSDNQDAATKAYVDSIAQGIIPHEAVRLASTNSDICGNSVSSGEGVGKTLTAHNTMEALLIDGVLANNGDRILLNDPSAPNFRHNGIYTVTDKGSDTTPYILTRASDFDGSPSSEVASGSFIFVTNGTNNGNSGFILLTKNPIVVDSSSIVFTPFSSAGQIVDGAGLGKSGNTLSVNVDNSTIEITSDSLNVKAGGITNNEISDTASIAWTKISLTGSSISDLASHSFSDLSDIPTQIDFHGLTAKTPLDTTDEFVIFNGTTYNKTTLADVTNGLAKTSDLSGLALDNAVVHIAGTESVTGTKNFDTIGANTVNLGDSSSSIADTDGYLVITGGTNVTINGVVITSGVIDTGYIDFANAPVKATVAVNDDSVVILDSEDGNKAKTITRANLLSGIATSEGLSKFIKIPVALGNAMSTSYIPAGAIIKSVTTFIKTAYTAGTSLEVTDTQNVIFQADTDIDATVSAVYKTEEYTLNSTDSSVTITISGSPTVGSADVIVEFISEFLS